MKKDFIGYYDLSDSELDQIWKDGIFSFDANTLLNLYRYSEETRTEFLKTLSALDKKLYLCHQAALEFHKNRKKVIEGTKQSYSELGKAITDNFDKHLLSQISRFKKHPTISIEKIKKLHEEFTKKVGQELDAQQKKHPDFKKNDTVLDQLTIIFDTCTGEKISKDELEKLCKEGEKRYADKIPPGYMDSDKKGADKFGDLIIWLDLINYTKTGKKPLIFVTDDRKEDWWQAISQEQDRPHPELIKEFFDMTGIRLMIYNADQFLREAKDRGILPTLTENTINEVKDVRISEKTEKKVTKFWGGGDAFSKISIPHNSAWPNHYFEENWNKVVFDKLIHEDHFKNIFREKIRHAEYLDSEILDKLKFLIAKKFKDDDDGEESGDLVPA
jgi:hypothetical protein